MAAVQQEQDRAWVAEVVDLKRQGLESAAIAEAVGKHPATVRKVIARAREDGTLTESGTAWPEDDGGPSEPIVGQVDIDGNVVGEEPAPEDDPEYEPEDASLHDGSRTVIDPLDDFKREAGEAVGPMPPLESEDTDPEVEVRLKGTRQLALDFGAEADIPVGGTVVLRSEKLASGFFGLGDVITGTFTARVVKVGGEEKLDKLSEEFRAKPVAHVALITEVAVDAA